MLLTLRYFNNNMNSKPLKIIQLLNIISNIIEILKLNKLPFINKRAFNLLKPRMF